MKMSLKGAKAIMKNCVQRTKIVKSCMPRTIMRICVLKERGELCQSISENENILTSFSNMFQKHVKKKGFKQ